MPLNDSFNTLVQDITEQALVQARESLTLQMHQLVVERLNEYISEDKIKGMVNSRISQQLHEFVPDTSKFNAELETLMNNLLGQLHLSANRSINDCINEKIKTIDLNTIFSQFIKSKLDNFESHLNLSDKSIAASAIDTTGLKITGDNIQGGVITSFSSTGIEDKAQSCQVTVLDQGTVFEKTVYASGLEVKGAAVIEGDLTIVGSITPNESYQTLLTDAAATVIQNLGPEILDQHETYIFNKIQQNGIDTSKLLINGQNVIEGQRLTAAIRDSNLETLGIVNDLQTRGESLLSQTLYVSKNRVGINTMDPSTALSVWDEEVEIGIGKQKQNVARIGSVRAHTLTLGTNKQDNITITPDGVVAIPHLRIGNMLFGSSSTPPSHDAARGTVIFNEQPNLGGPMGWVSLGNARWANFGVID